MALKMEKVNYNYQTAHFMQVNLKIIIFMEMELSYGPMEEHTQDNGFKIKCRDKG